MSTMKQKAVSEEQPPPTHDLPLDDGGQPKAEAANASSAAEKQSLPKRLWIASGLNPGILIMMFKGAIAPTIALAVYQATSIARIYSTLGYLVAIMSILSMPILPRSK